MEKKHNLIRGPRILQQLLAEESTISDLDRNTKTFIPVAGPQARQNAVGQVIVTKIELTPARQSQALNIKGIVTSNGSQYEPSIMFKEVIFEDSDQADNTTFKAIDNQEYHIIPIDLMKHNAKVRCNCLDFYYRFASSNSKNDSLIGPPPPPYVKKTNRPPVNPQQVPALCKHLLRLIQQLRLVQVVK